MKDFKAFTVKFSGRTNVLFCDVGVSQAFDFNIITTNRPPITTIRSIWDTGATCTVISKKLATQIGLIPTGKTTITGVNHSTLENTYLVNVYLPNKVAIMFIKIAEVPAITGGAELLIGMDIIGSGDFSVYTEDEKTIMTYRFPSIGGEDFVATEDTIRRNQALAKKFEDERNSRKPISEKERQKRAQKRKDQKRSKKHK